MGVHSQERIYSLQNDPIQGSLIPAKRKPLVNSRIGKGILSRREIYDKEPKFDKQPGLMPRGGLNRNINNIYMS